jgi:hypothetical protein
MTSETQLSSALQSLSINDSLYQEMLEKTRNPNNKECQVLRNAENALIKNIDKIFVMFMPFFDLSFGENADYHCNYWNYEIIGKYLNISFSTTDDVKIMVRVGFGTGIPPATHLEITSFDFRQPIKRDGAISFKLERKGFNELNLCLDMKEVPSEMEENDKIVFVLYKLICAINEHFQEYKDFILKNKK